MACHIMVNKIPALALGAMLLTQLTGVFNSWGPQQDTLAWLAGCQC